MTHDIQTTVMPPASPYGPDRTLTMFFENFATFRGFATREEFWWPFILTLTVHAAIAVTASIVIGTMFPVSLVADTSGPPGLTAVPFTMAAGGAGAAFLLALASLQLIISAVTAPPLLAVTWRRLHDTGLPGSMFFLAFIPGVGWIVMLILLSRRSAPSRHHAEWCEKHI